MSTSSASSIAGSSEAGVERIAHTDPRGWFGLWGVVPRFDILHFRFKPSPSSWKTHHQTLLSPQAARLATPYFAALSERLAATLSYYHCHTTISEHFHPTALRLRPFLAVAETEGPIHGCTRKYMYIRLSTSDIFENENEDGVKGRIGRRHQ